MPFNLVPVINVHSFEGYDIKYEELNQRLNHVKKEFGLRRAVSTHTLTGETRTFAEILDLQVETIVLYYLEIQGLLSRQLRILRSEQVEKLQACNVSMPIIDDFCHKYRIIGLEILDLLHYLEKNSLSLRKILHRHDALFDQKMGSMYFDTRFNGSSKNSQLRQLYHQEGVKALVASIRRGFEELYDARNVLIQPQQLLYATDGRDSPLLGRSFDGSIIGPSGKQTHKLIPKVSFRKRLASFSSLHHLFQQTQASEGTTSDNNSNNNNNTSNNLSSLANNGSSETTPLNQDSMKRNVVSTNDLDQLLNSANNNNNNNVPYTRQRSLSDLEPILHQISDVANKLLKTQSKTTVEFLSSYGAMGLELSMNEIRRAVQGDDTSSGKTSSTPTSLAGLYLNLFVTFIYLANQYIVAPTSAQYAAILGLGPSMSGMIIGLAPVAALLSAFIYSQWSNTSFKHPLLFSIFFGILGNLLYALALQCHSTLLLFLGRLVTGFGGTRVVSRRYIADHVAIEDRLLASSQFVTAGAMGLAFGPLLAALIERSNVSFTMYGFDGKTVLFIYENVNAPGWIMTVLWAISFFAVLFYFEEPKIAEKKPSPKPANYTTEDIVFVETGNELWGNNNDPISTTNHGVEMKSTAHKHVPFHESLKQKHMGGSLHANETTPMLGHSALRSNYGNNGNDLFNNNGGYSLRPKAKSKEPSCFEFITFEVYILLFILTVNKTGQELAISSMPFLGREVFNLSVESPGYYMALIGTLVLPTNIFVSQMFKDMEERDIVLRLSYFILFGIGLICHFGAFGDYSLFQYIFGTSVVFTYLNSLEGVIMSLLSKLISPDLAKGTFNSGLLATEAGTLGRVLGDMAITVFGNDSSRSPMLVNQLYLPFAMLVVTTVLLMQQFYERFVE